jgi:hypothetical protein
MKQDENDENHKKKSTLVVGNKPNGKCQFTWLSRISSIGTDFFFETI